MTVAFLLITLVILTAAYLRFRGGASLLRGAGSAPVAVPAIRATPRGGTSIAPGIASSPVPSRRPEAHLEMPEWVARRERGDPPRMPAPQDRIRDRYLALRFEGAIRNAGDLRLSGRVIDVARLYFEEDRIDCAQELLALAIEASPRDASLRLARIEIAFLTGEVATFIDAARGLDIAVPDCPQWSDVQRLGRALHPDEPLFGVAAAVRAHEHYGAWPDTPNWIGACWDLSGDVRAADFHLAMSQAPPHGQPAIRSAA